MENKAYWGAYGVSKKALLGLMETLAKELESSSVCVNAILPNPMNTPLRSKAFPGENINTVMPIESIIPDYINLITTNFDNADNDTKWEMYAQQQFIAHYGNGTGSYNLYRRKGI